MNYACELPCLLLTSLFLNGSFWICQVDFVPIVHFPITLHFWSIPGFVGNGSLLYIYIYIKFTLDTFRCRYNTYIHSYEPHVCISIHIYISKDKGIYSMFNKTKHISGCAWGWARRFDVQRIVERSQQGGIWVHYTVWHHQVGMKLFEPLKKSKAMLASLMIGFMLEEVLPLAWLGLRWLGPPFEQLIKGEQLGWHTISNTTHVMTTIRGGSSPHTILSSSKGPTSWFRASCHGPGGFDKGTVILPLILHIRKR